MGAGLISSTVPAGHRDDAGSGALHTLLLRLAGSLADHLMVDARARLAGGRSLDVAREVAFEVISQQVRLAAGEIEVLRAELGWEDSDGDLAAALEELRGDRQPEPWVFLSALPTNEDDVGAATRPMDLTGEPREYLDAVDRALVTEASTVPGMRGVWRAWRMPPTARPWQEPVRVAVASVDAPRGVLPALTVRLHRAMVAAGDADAQVEVCGAGLDTPFYQTLARTSGALLWASKPAAPITLARVYDGVDPVRGPWFTTNRPVISNVAERDHLVTALRSAVVVRWNSVRTADVLAPERGDVVPLHRRTDGTWVWSDAVTYYLERYGLAPDPTLVEHLVGRDRAEPMDEIAVHRVLTHLSSWRADGAVRLWPGVAAASSVVPSRGGTPGDPWRPGEPVAADGGPDPYAGS